MHCSEVFPYVSVDFLEVKTTSNTGISIVGDTLLSSFPASFVNTDFDSYPVPLLKLTIRDTFIRANVNSHIWVHKIKGFQCLNHLGSHDPQEVLARSVSVCNN